ncbi:MAG: 50S ribosomal protein L6 [Patescibacteria group bacterium]
MSRIGNLPIQIPSGVTIEKIGNTVVVNGPKGKLDFNFDPTVKVEVEGDRIIVRRESDDKNVRSLHGLTRSLIANMISGVTKGWSRNLELVGVGFRAQTDGKKLNLNIGFSHPVEVNAPENVTFEVSDNTKITVLGCDKQFVGQVAANIRKIKVPDVYKGKGIRFEGEYIRKKAGKAAKVGTVGIGGNK